MRFFIIILLCSINLNAFGQDTLALSKQVFEQNNYTQTIILLDEYTKHHNNDSAAFELCGDAYFEMNLYTNAAHNFSKAIAIVKSNGLLLFTQLQRLFLFITSLPLLSTIVIFRFLMFSVFPCSCTFITKYDVKS